MIDQASRKKKDEGVVDENYKTKHCLYLLENRIFLISIIPNNVYFSVSTYWKHVCNRVLINILNLYFIASLAI